MRLDFSPSRGVNAIVGGNGQGKTSLLESLYFVATSRSFRTDQVREVLAEKGEGASVRARLEDGVEAWEQSAGLGVSERVLAVNGVAPKTVADFAIRTPVVVFHPGDLQLVTGSASARRRLLDRLALFAEPASAVQRGRYARAAKERQRILCEKGVRARELDGYEEVMAESGAELTGARMRAAVALGGKVVSGFGQIGEGREEVETRYAAGGSGDPMVFVAALQRARHVDARRRSGSYGPHRDELEIRLGGRSVRKLASQGQRRLVALALKLGELECVREARGRMPVLLLDDVWSELDAEREGAVRRYLLAVRGQVFVTGTREMIGDEATGGRRVEQWRMQKGELVRGG